MAGEIVPFREKVKTVRELLTAMKPQLALALPRFLTPERMVRVSLTAIQRNPILLDCTQPSLAGAILQAAQLGLEPDGVLGHAYLVPFRNNKRGGIMECQLIPGYKGLIQLSRRSAQISTVEAVVVHAKDKFRVRRGLNPILEHEPFPGNEDPGSPVAAYAIARLRDGGYQFEFMWKREIDQVRDRYSRAAGEGPWVTNYEEMAKKTVLKRLSKLLPASVELQTAVALDDLAETGIPQDLEALTEAPLEQALVVGELERSMPSSLDRLADQVEGQKVTGSPPAEDPQTQGDGEPRRSRGRPRKPKEEPIAGPVGSSSGRTPRAATEPGPDANETGLPEPTPDQNTLFTFFRESLKEAQNQAEVVSIRTEILKQWNDLTEPEQKELRTLFGQKLTALRTAGSPSQ